MEKTRKFTNRYSANAFAKRVGGTVEDLNSNKDIKSNWTVKYEPTKAKLMSTKNWCPEEGRDFGYPNEFWQ
jgi:hypothetical protein